MPYIFIWGGYIFRNMDPSYSVTKIDQGCIEKYFGTIKRIRGHQPIVPVPAKHVLHSMKYVLANCIIITAPKAMKRKRAEHEKIEQNNVDAVSEWSSKNLIKSVSNKKNLILARQKKQNMGFQKPQKTLNSLNKKSTQNTFAMIQQPQVNADNDSEDLKIDESKSSPPINETFCYTCQIQFKKVAEVNQHKKTKKHQTNLEATKTKFIVGQEIITFKDFDLLCSDKGGLSDAVIL